MRAAFLLLLAALCAGVAVSQDSKGGRPGYGNLGTPGNQGSQGGWGSSGSQGNQGGWGSSGSQGSQGGWGSSGSQGRPNQGGWGSSGSQGNQGGWGSSGSQGNQGGWGSSGSQGRPNQGGWGSTGSQGNQGGWGSSGSQGNQGGWGSSGSPRRPNQGSWGSTGSQGIEGGWDNQGRGKPGGWNIQNGQTTSNSGIIRTVYEYPKGPCTPGSKVQYKCNTCSCDSNGKYYLCSRRTCSDSLPGRGGNIHTPTNKCTPGTSFKSPDGCNDCYCGSTGVATCTTKACLPQNPNVKG